MILYSNFGQSAPLKMNFMAKNSESSGKKRNSPLAHNQHFKGVHPDFEIAVDQQTRARDRNFEGVPDSG